MRKIPGANGFLGFLLLIVPIKKLVLYAVFEAEEATRPDFIQKFAHTEWTKLFPILGSAFRIKCS